MLLLTQNFLDFVPSSELHPFDELGSSRVFDFSSQPHIIITSALYLRDLIVLKLNMCFSDAPCFLAFLPDNDLPSQHHSKAPTLPLQPDPRPGRRTYTYHTGTLYTSLSISPIAPPTRLVKKIPTDCMDPPFCNCRRDRHREAQSTMMAGQGFGEAYMRRGQGRGWTISSSDTSSASFWRVQ